MEGREHLSAEFPPARPGHPQPCPGGWPALWGWPGARGRKSGEEALAKQGCGAGGFQPSPVSRRGPPGGCEAPLTVGGRQGEAEDLRGQSVSCEPSTWPSTCQASLCALPHSAPSSLRIPGGWCPPGPQDVHLTNESKGMEESRNLSKATRGRSDGAGVQTCLTFEEESLSPFLPPLLPSCLPFFLSLPSPPPPFKMRHQPRWVESRHSLLFQPARALPFSLSSPKAGRGDCLSGPPFPDSGPVGEGLVTGVPASVSETGEHPEPGARRPPAPRVHV